MAAPTNYFKLGLFVLLTLAGTVVVAIVLGAQSMRKETVAVHTYFNEAVTGLDVGAPVRFRGVHIGSVTAIEVAPDHRHVDVVSELELADLERMGLHASRASNKRSFTAPADMRAQLGSQGITGVKFVSLDFFDAKSNPPPEVPFPVPPEYIPAARSMMKNLEDTVTRAMDRLPDLVDAVVAIATRVDRMIAQLERDDVTGQLSTTLRHVDGVVTGLAQTVASIDRAHLPERSAAVLDDTQKAVTKLNSVLDRVDGDNGLISSVRRASDAFGAFGKGATSNTRELDQTLREVREAAESIRLLADSLERDPDMLLKGRAKAKQGASPR